MCYDKTDKKNKGGETMLFLEYPKCSTCKKAKKWLDEQVYLTKTVISFEDNPTVEELKDWHERSGLPLKRFLTQAV